MIRFPINAIPDKIRETIYDIREHTQAPVELISSSVISAMSMASQSIVDVKINETVTTPASLFLLVIANSGERKTTVDRMVLKPFYRHDACWLRQAEEQEKIFEVETKIWSAKEKAILNTIRRKVTKDQCTKSESQRLVELQSEKPVLPKIGQYIYNNVTPEALQFAMYSRSAHIGLIADEGANILDRQVMNDLSFINSMWDGVDFRVERKTAQSFTIENGRVTLSVMVQKKPFDLYLKRQGGKARGSGFFARCLPVVIDEKLTTQGERLIRQQPAGMIFLEQFHQRLEALISERTTSIESNQQRCLSFALSAQHEWEKIYNEIECRIRPDERYAHMSDFASKLANNVARLSALFSFFTEGERLIKKEYVEGAWKLCEWYMEQAINLFGCDDGYYEALLISWLQREFSTQRNTSLRYNDIRRNGPNVLRKGTLLTKVMDNLECAGVIDIDYQRSGARVVYKGDKFSNNIFTKNPAYRHY
ncbi:YfjI family protein [Citrobacter sp. Cpo109]|uniref:YfjI family protein n=1 Tax=Citrobacter TaxID=544 RepID=UPI002577AFD5|nr:MULTISPECIES: YfjI family protein [Citrobacter]MDM2804713.1 YfjI family protein [Citrobacter sp. Cpo109]MEB1110785.1 YfjI family protein [Citrobacter portucalensis]